VRRAASLLVAVFCVAAVAAAPAEPASAQRTQAQGTPVTLALAAQAFTVDAGGQWTARFTVTGDLGAAAPSSTTTTTAAPTTTAAGVAAVEARVLLRRRIADPTDLADVLDGSTPPVSSRLTIPVTLTTDGEQTTFTVSVPTATDPDDAGALVLQRAGVYPVTVQLVVGGETLGGADTFLDRLPTAAPRRQAPFSVAVLTDIADPGASPTPAELAADGTALQAIAESAAALGGVMSLHVPPAIAQYLQANDPALLASLQPSLGASEVLSSPAPPLDPSSAAGAGLQEPFARSLRAGEDLLRAALPATPPERSGWIVASPISTAGAGMLRDPLGFDLLVFDRAVYDTLEGGIGGYHDPSQSFDVDLGGGATLPGFVVSPSSHWLDGDDLDRRALSPTDGAVRLMSELVVARDTYGPERRRSVVLTLPPGVAPDPEVAAALAGYVATTPGFRLARLSMLPSATEPMMVPGRGREVVHLPAIAGPDLSARVDRINLTRLAAASASSLLSDDVQLDRWNASLDALLSTAVGDREADTELDRISGEVRAIYDDIVMPLPFTFTLTGRRSTLRLNLRNTGSHDLHVVVRPSSPKLRFPDGDEEVELGAGATTEVVIPVEAQTNGTSSLAVELVTPTGGQTVQGPVVLTARVNALSGLGQVVTGGAVLVLVSWWYGHFRRRRRERRALLGEVDNPPRVDTAVLSPDAAEAVAAVATDGHAPQPEPTPSPAEPVVAEDVVASKHERT
jgi:hypothetical protein